MCLPAPAAEHEEDPSVHNLRKLPLLAGVAAGGTCSADLSLVNQFNTSATVRLAIDRGSGTIWSYPEFGADIRR